MTPPVAPPIVVANGADCAFYRDLDSARRAVRHTDARVFDHVGTRLVVDGDGWQVGPTSDGADELAGVLRNWLAAMDALRESTANWSLELLVRASVDHLGYS